MNIFGWARELMQGGRGPGPMLYGVDLPWPAPPDDELATLVERAQVLSLKPGDVLVLHHPGVLTPAAHARLQDIGLILAHTIGFKPAILILEEGMTLSVLRAEVLGERDTA